MDEIKLWMVLCGVSVLVFGTTIAAWVMQEIYKKVNPDD